MNLEQFSHIVTHPNKLSKETLKELKTVVDHFPYCQTAHILLAKGQHDAGSMMATQNIRKAALYTLDRKNLKRFIESNEVELPEFIDLPESKEEDTVESNVSIEVPDKEVFEEIDEKPKTENTLAENTTENASSLQTVDDKSEERDSSDATTPTDSNEKVEVSEPRQDAEVPNFSTPDETTADEEFLSEVEKNLLALQRAKEKANELLEKPIEIIAPQEEPQKEAPKKESETPATKPNPEKATKTKAKKEESQKKQHDKKTEPKTESASTNANKSESKSPKVSTTKTSSSSTRKKEPTSKIKKQQPKAKNYPKLNEVDDKVGFDIYTSRWGEMLHEKDDKSSAYTREFHPDLFLLKEESEPKLKVSNSTPQKTTPQKPKANTTAIIDKFIASEPSITPIKSKKQEADPSEDLSAKSSVLKGTLVTENMAKIYVKQENFKKAKEIYEALKLKYPEKKTYFADQISKLK